MVYREDISLVILLQALKLPHILRYVRGMLIPVPSISLSFQPMVQPATEYM
jgi:hypothetical protein